MYTKLRGQSIHRTQDKHDFFYSKFKGQLTYT